MTRWAMRAAMSSDRGRRRLRDLVSGRDVVARLGGDEFLLFLDDPDDEAAIMQLARQMPRALARPIAVRGQQVRLGASMGIALYPRDGADVATLFQHADIALEPRQNGRTRHGAMFRSRDDGVVRRASHDGERPAPRARRR